MTSHSQSLSPKPLLLERSLNLLAEAKELIPGVTQSLMKRPEAFAPGAYPVYLASGAGATVRDVDGNEYIDYVCGLGANGLGHNHPAIVEAILEALRGGLSHSLPTELELEAARRLVEVIPGAERVRFFKTGADATSAAVRLARHVTGKSRILTVGYNGWHDHFMYDTSGVPSSLSQLSQRMPLFSESDEPRLLERVAQDGRELAAVVLSLPYGRCISADFLHRLRAACHAVSALLVLDEVVTGFRLALGGAQELFDLSADIVCLSKALAAGMPLSAVTGPRAILEQMEALQVSTTFGGERLSLAACHAALGVYRDTPAIAHMHDMGERLRDGVNRVSEATGASLRIVGYAPIPFFQFSPDPVHNAAQMEHFLAGMARRGVLLRRDVNFLSCVHTPDQIEHTIDAAQATLEEMSPRARAADALGKQRRA